MRETSIKETGDFTAVLNLNADPPAVSALFTSADGVSRWWGPTEGDADAGGTLITSFGQYGANAMRVLEAGPTRIVWESIAADGTPPTGHTKEWLGTTIQFDITPADDRTELRFTHAGLTHNSSVGTSASPHGRNSSAASRARRDRHRRPFPGLNHQ